MREYILAIDQGTTSSRAILYALSLDVVDQVQEEFTQHFPQNGWVEHDPEDIWQSVVNCCKKVIQQNHLSADQIKAIGITNQRETTLVWDKVTGEPIYPAIVWQDRRTSAFCRQLSDKGFDQLFKEKTGLLIDPYFSGTKVNWILKNVKSAQQKAENDQLCFGTVDSYLLWRLTNGQTHATDATNASRTLLFNIHEQQWDEELLDILQIPKSMLGEVRDNACHYGVTTKDLFGAEIPICSLVGDQQAALIGQACFKPGQIKSTYGTGCFAIVNTGKQALDSKNRLLTTVGYRIDGQVTYALEGSIFMAGAVVQWLRDGLQLFQVTSDSEKMAGKVGYEQSEILVPAFTGLGAPYWDPDARAAFFGMTRDTDSNKLIAAAIKSVALQTRDLLLAMSNDGVAIKILRVDGGMINNRFFIRALADLTGIEVERTEINETTAMGAAVLAAYQIGLLTSLEVYGNNWKKIESIKPSLDEETKEIIYEQWKSCVDKVRTNG